MVRKGLKALGYIFLGAVFVVVGLAASVGAIERARLAKLPVQVQSELAHNGSNYVRLRDISPTLRAAVIATEDRSFYSNPGVSVAGIGRSLVRDVLTGQATEGGSTITQQLVRDQLFSSAKTLQRKFEEIVLAVELTQTLPKNRILELYLNQVYLGHGAYGVAAAAKTYFGTTPSALTPAEATLLAGLPQAPSFLDPLINPADAKKRQWEVLQSMVAAGNLTPQQARAIFKAPWKLQHP